MPVIAAVHGHALGGGLQIALGADIRFCAPDAQLSVREVHWGLVPDMTGTYVLSRLVRPDIAKELRLHGQGGRAARRATQLGLVTHVTPNPLEDALALAREIAGTQPRRGAGLEGAAQRRAAGRTRPTQFAEERRVIGGLVGTPNQVEAVMANFETPARGVRRRQRPEPAPEPEQCWAESAAPLGARAVVYALLLRTGPTSSPASTQPAPDSVESRTMHQLPEHDRASTTPASSTTPVASRSSSTSRVAPATPSCRPVSARSATSSTAGPSGAEADTGDGAGILLQVPDRFLRAVVGLRAAPGRHLRGRPGVPADRPRGGRRRRGRGSRRSSTRRASTVLGWRDVPTDPTRSGRRPTQVHAARSGSSSSPTRPGTSGLELDRKLFCARKRIEHEVTSRASERPCTSRRCRAARSSTRACSPRRSSATFFPDLGRRADRVGPGPRAQPVLHEHVPVVAARPPVPLPRPQRRDQHRAGQPQLDAGPRGAAGQRPRSPGDLERIFPICTPGARATRRRFDEVLELLHLGGRAAAPRRADDDPRGVGAPRVDGPGQAGLLPLPRLASWSRGTARPSMAFTDGTVIGAVLDRNGLRPSRYWVTDDDLVIMASEVGVVDVDPAQGREEGPPAAGPHVPGRHGAGPDRRRRGDQGRRSPPSTRTRTGSHAGLVDLEDLPEREHVIYSHECVLRRQQVFGYTHEELKIILAPMAKTGAEPIGSMGTDTPIAVLSEPPAAAVRLLPAALRPGHQPAARRHPRGAGHGARLHHRPRGEPAGPRRRRQLPPGHRCPFRSSTTTSWPSSSTSTPTATSPGFAAVT